MSRLIRYRAWRAPFSYNDYSTPPVGKKTIQVPGRYVVGDDCYLGMDGKTYQYDYELINDEPYRDITIELDTGLVDKTGAPIYEGDIVRFTIGSGVDFDSHRTHTSVVTYDVNSAAFKLADPWGSDRSYSMLDLKHTAEVVGHIHDRETHDRFFGIACA